MLELLHDLHDLHDLGEDCTVSLSFASQHASYVGDIDQAARALIVKDRWVDPLV